MSGMKIVTSPKTAGYIAEQGGKVWVWLDPRRGLIGSYVWLEAHTEPPGASRRTKFTRSSRRLHRFATIEAAGVEVHYDWGRLDPPDELLLEVKGIVNKRLEAYWDGCVFVDQGAPAPGLTDRPWDAGTAG
jgi:hypothetical protein